MNIRFLLPVLCLCLALPLHAEVRYDLDDPALAATVDGEPMSTSFVDMMLRIARKGDAGITRDAVVQALIDDRLVAAHMRTVAHGESLIEDNKVGFSPALQIEQAMIANIQAGFRETLEARLKREKGGTLDGVVVATHRPTAAEWEAVLGRPRLLLDYALDEKARAAADALVLLRYRFDRNTAGQITLLDVYDAQNVQGRNQLHARNGDFAAEQARQILKRRYILRWARSSEGMGEGDVELLRRATEDRLVHGGWMAHLGVAADIHDDPPHLAELQAAVTPAEIRAYYAAHRDDFRRIEKVKARHVRLKDEATAQAVAARLRNGDDFAALARQFSLAPDAPEGGDLGWIVHGDNAHGWLDSLAFLQAPGVASRPTRLPAAAGEEPGWEILLVEERVMGWQPEESESVRYQAARIIARQKALAEYHATLARLRREADIRLPADSALRAPAQEARR